MNARTDKLKADRRLAHAIAWIQIEKLFALGEKRISHNNQIMNREEWSDYKLATIHKSLYNKDLKAQGFDHTEHNRRNRINFAEQDKKRLESGSHHSALAHLYRRTCSPFFYIRRWHKKGGLVPATSAKREVLQDEIDKADGYENQMRYNARQTKERLHIERQVEQHRKHLEEKRIYTEDSY